MKMKELLYINNYNCTNKHRDGYPDQHLWGVDALSKTYNVTCAQVPKDIVKNGIKGAGRINSFLKSLVLLIRYFKYDIVYSACGDLTDAFALANILHFGRRRLYKIQHHGNSHILFSKGYSKIIFISPVIKEYFSNFKNTCLLTWGGQQAFASPYIKDSKIEYDFVSAGKANRDFQCMAHALEGLEAHAIIITSTANFDYDTNKIEVVSGTTPYPETYKYYSVSKFICIPTRVLLGKAKGTLSALTSFVDAAIMHKPVLVSDNTNMGIDVDGLGIGLTYKAGDAEDMRLKMQHLLSLTDEEYKRMCKNMEEYSKIHNYDTFCNELVQLVSSE